MALSIGIVGLPNVGKSTTFNALTKAQNAQAANYPFCTIEPNKATVPVPDSRIDMLVNLVHPQKTINATVDFIDIAGLVRGASKGEGLGNQFLGNIRECAAVLEVVRCFEDDDITHVDGSVDPLRDIETIETEQVDNNSHLTNILREYREFGFKTAIDDFGAGYSGLNLLADFQPDLIKLDMALIRDIDRDKARQAIVRGIVTICADLAVTVIAEGIETAGERDFLADAGIYLMQGYWFAKPAFKALAEIPATAWR